MSELINEFVWKFNFLKRFPLFGKDLFIASQKVNRKHCMKSVDIGSFSGRNTRKYGPQNLQTWNLFTQWKSVGFDPFCAGIRFYSNTFQYCTTFAKTSKGIGTFARNGSLVTTYFVSFYTHFTKKWNFPLRNSVVYVNKRARNCRSGHICWRNSGWKTSFFGAVYSVSLH